MKKLMSLMMVCAMLATTAMGCGDDAAESTATTTTTTATTTTTEAEETTTTEATTTTPEIPAPTVDANAITFEDDDLWTAHAMCEKNFENDESNVELTVEEFNGTKQLRIQVLDKDDNGTYKVPKIVFNIAELVGAENIHKIKKISCDFTSNAVGEFTGDDGTAALVPGNAMGALAGGLAAEKKTDADGGLVQNTWATFTEFAFDCWDWQWCYSHVDANILLDANCYEEGNADATFVIMRWGIPNQADLYVDNITFYDADGNSIPLVYSPS